MGYEPKPNKTVDVKKGADQYDWLSGRPDRNVILNWAKKTGAAVPAGLNIDRFGKSSIDENGIRHNWVLKDGDPQGDYATRQRYRNLGYTVVLDESGDGFNISIPQTKFEDIQKASEAQYQQQRLRGLKRTGVQGGVDRDRDYVEEVTEERRNLSVDDILDGIG